MVDPTNAARQARHRKARALGYEHVAGYLPPKRAAKVRLWLDEAERDALARRIERLVNKRTDDENQ
jgi:hypothetical protein